MAASWSKGDTDQKSRDMWNLRYRVVIADKHIKQATKRVIQSLSKHIWNGMFMRSHEFQYNLSRHVD